MANGGKASPPKGASAWVDRVFNELGLTRAADAAASETGNARDGAAAGFASDWALALDRWRDANDIVDRQISELQGRLRSSGDPDLERIAELGLNAIAGNTRVRLMAAILDVSRGGDRPAPRLVKSAAQAASALEAHLASDPRVAACDQNPFGARVTIGATLGAALAELRRALAGVDGR